jgi:hypothetical protein
MEPRVSPGFGQWCWHAFRIRFHPDFVFEAKLDGFRAMAYIDGGRCELSQPKEPPPAPATWLPKLAVVALPAARAHLDRTAWLPRLGPRNTPDDRPKSAQHGAECPGLVQGLIGDLRSLT